MFVIFAFISTFEFSDITRVKQTNIYEYVYLASMSISILLLTVNLGFRIVVYCCKKCKRPSSVAMKYTSEAIKE